MWEIATETAFQTIDMSKTEDSNNISQLASTCGDWCQSTGNCMAFSVELIKTLGEDKQPDDKLFVRKCYGFDDKDVTPALYKFT
jgi:hypothetical protein